MGYRGCGEHLLGECGRSPDWSQCPRRATTQCRASREEISYGTGAPIMQQMSSYTGLQTDGRPCHRHGEIYFIHRPLATGRTQCPQASQTSRLISKTCQCKAKVRARRGGAAANTGTPPMEAGTNSVALAPPHPPEELAGEGSHRTGTRRDGRIECFRGEWAVESIRRQSGARPVRECRQHNRG